MIEDVWEFLPLRVRKYLLMLLLHLLGMLFSFFSSSLSSTLTVLVASSSVSLPKASISFCSSSSNVISSGVFSFLSSDDEKSCFIFLRYLLAPGFPGCLGVGSFDDVGLL